MSPEEQGPTAPQQHSVYTLPGCYRHPDRETGIRCGRCERPVCPDCRVDAAVGFQCRECVRSGRSSVRQGRTAFGGAVARGDGALVTKVLIGLNVAVFLLTFVMSTSLLDGLYLLGSFPGYDGGVAQGQWYRMLTSMFLHTQVLHIGMNMLSLWWIGPALEQLLGRWRFLALYLVSGLAGAALFLLIAPHALALGASGAIFGLLGALVVLQRRRGADLGPVVAIVVVNLVATFTITGIAWEDHVGGLVAGALIGAGMAYAPNTRHRSTVQWGSLAAVLALVVAVTAVAVG